MPRADDGRDLRLVRRGTIPDHWPNCPRPAGEELEAFAAVWGDVDGNAVPDAS